jgi:DNA-directed RNA polymerase beta subunit/DNA-directed RNA polymerase beta' subunit
VTHVSSHSQVFEGIKKSATDALQEFFPIDGKTKQLVLKNVQVRDDKDPHNFAEQEKVKLNGGTWGVPIHGDLYLIDKASGHVVDQVEGMKLMTLPKTTAHRYSYIVNGNEYQVVNQLRLKPAIYHRVKANEEIEAQVNSARGLNFKIPFNRNTGVFHLQVGTSNIKLYPLLRDLGITDKQIETHWGQDILRANQQASAGVADTESQKLYSRLYHKEEAVDRPAAIEGIKQYLSTMTEFDPEIMHYQLGKRFERFEPEAMLKSSQKLLRMSQGELEPDDRESIVVKKIMDLGDFLGEKLKLTKTKNALFNKVVSLVDRKDRIKEIIKHEDLNRPVESFFTQSELSNAEQQINPLHMLSATHKLTFHGEGGIQSEQAVTPEARAVHPTHFGFLDPIQTPEGHNVGAVMHMASGLIKDGNDLKTHVYQAQTGKKDYITAKKFYDSTVAFPDEYDENMKPRKATVRAMHKGEIVEVPAKAVDYTIATAKSMFSLGTNMMPFMGTVSGNRALLTAKMQEQALPLVYREEPLVQVKLDDKGSYEQYLGGLYSFKSPVTGVVTDVSNGIVLIRSASKVHKVNVYDNFPLNSKHFLHTDMTVKVGDVVKAGQLLGDTNYTKGGKLALGTNLRVAYMPWHGYNYEDGSVLSESGAKKLSSMHMHKESIQLGEDITIDRGLFRAHYPGHAEDKLYNKLDDRGLIQVGQIVQPGDLLATVLRRNNPSAEDEVMKKIHKSLVKPWRNLALHWEYATPGEVVKVGKHGKRLDIYIKTVEPMVVGDKLAGRYANKSIVTRILTDAEMPHTADGEPMDLILNPQGVPSRMNLGTVLDTALSKAAKKKGSPYAVENFAPGHTTEYVKNELKKHGFDPSGTEVLIDPSDNKPLGNVLNGHQYIMKLDHSVDKKYNARNTAGYSSEGVPVRGSDEGGQSADPLLMYTMLSHGARANLFDMAAVKSERNDEFWRALQTGRPLPPPKPTFVFDKFIALLKGLGVNVEKKGDHMVLSPLTDKHTLEMSAGAIQNATGLLAKDLSEEPGGLFDPQITGGRAGSKFSHVNLAEALPNPLYEDAIKTVLDINEDTFLGLIEGRKSVNDAGQIVDGIEGLTGGTAFQKLFSVVNVPTRISALTQEAITAPPQRLNKLHKQIRYLQALQKNNLTPSDAYLMTKLPVIPPKFRPIYPLPDGNLLSSDLNYIYKDIFINNKKLAEAKDVLPEEDVAKLRMGVYNYISGLTGLSDTPSFRKYKGILTEIRGQTQSKEGLFQAKLVARRQDLTARSTIVNDPNLGADEIGIPEEMAKTVYTPFIVKRLVGLGISPLQAEQEIENGTQLYKNALLQEMERRPVLLNRAPSLHKFSIMAFKPQLTDGKAIKMPAMPMAGMGADVDGDTCAIHVPVSEAATQEAWHMLPTNHLLNPGSGKLMLAPAQEAVVGLYNLTAAGAQESNKYPTVGAAFKALKTGSLYVTDQVEIAGIKTTAGRALVNELLPKDLRNYETQWTKGSLNKLFMRLQEKYPKDYGSIVDSIRMLGNKHATKSGYTLSLADFDAPIAKREAILAVADKEVAKIKASSLSEQEKKLKIIDIYNKATEQFNVELKKLSVANNGLLQSVASGARGDWTQIRQILMAPMLLRGADGNIIPVPARRSYAEGLTTADYFIQSFGARAGAVDKNKQTSVPGYFNKRLINCTVDQVVAAIEDPNDEGVPTALDSPGIKDRFLAVDYPGVAKRGDLVTDGALAALKRKGLSEIQIMSPLSCTMHQGVAAKSIGLMPGGKLPAIGDNVGVTAAQAMGEPGTQMIMRCQDKHATVLMRFPNGEMHYTTHEALWDMIPLPVSQAGNREEKYLDFAGYYVWDIDGWVQANKITRHTPDVPVRWIKTRSGYGILVQQDHPMFVTKEGWRCSSCGRRTYERIRAGRDFRVLSCVHCKVEVKLTDEQWAVQRSFVKAASCIDSTDFLDVVTSLPDELKAGQVPCPSIDGYLAGMYVAEGSLLRAKPQRKYADTKGRWLNGFIISQNEGPIRDKIKEHLLAAKISFREQGINLTVYHREWAHKIYSWFGTVSDTKRLPSQFLQFDITWMTDFVCGLLDGDSSLRVTGDGTIKLILGSTSHAVVAQVQLFLATQGIPSSRFIRPPQKTPIGKNRKRCFYLNIPVFDKLQQLLRNSLRVLSAPTQQRTNRLSWLSRGNVTSQVSSCKEVPYGGYTYDIATVTESYLVTCIRSHNSFHTGGVATGGIGSNLAAGMERVLQLFEMPETLQGAGTLATTDGLVSQIEKAPQGGHYVYVNDIRHYVPATRQLMVKVGDQAVKGVLISDGIIRPQDLLLLKGMRAVQNYLVDEILHVYADQGINLRRSIVETVVRPLTNLARVTDPGDLEDHVPGDYVSLAALEQKRRAGSSVQYQPILKGINTLPLFSNEDWISQLNFRDLNRTVMKGASMGWSSDLHGYNPIASYVYGASFGKNPTKPGGY